MSLSEYKKENRPREEFLVCTRLLPSIRSKYSAGFELLEIPETTRFEETTNTYYFRHYGDQTYNSKWTEETGGSLLGTELSSEMPRLIQDFEKIDINWVLNHPVVEAIGKVSFDLEDWLRSFRERADGLGLSENELVQVQELVSTGFGSDERIISNGDFYPRNLVRFEERFAVIDWGYWSGSRACFIDYLPNVAAFAYIHMWNNERWRKEFATAVAGIGVTPEDLRKAIAIKAFEQAAYWKNHPTLWPPQVSLFRKALQNTLS
jgi:hypothetical protein